MNFKSLDKKPASARRLARVTVVQGLYKYEQTKDHQADIVNEFSTYNFLDYIDETPENDENIQDASPSKETTMDVDYFKHLMDHVLQHLSTIDPCIQENLQTNWKIERISSVVRCILRSAVYELCFEKLVPTAVVINEYIEIGRLFVDEKEVKFIHSLLDRVAKQVR